MASAGADENTLNGGEPGPGPVTDETELEPVQLIARSDAASRIGALMLGAGTGSFRVLQAMRRVTAAIGLDRLQAQVTLTHVVSTTTRQGIFRTQVVEVPTPASTPSPTAGEAGRFRGYWQAWEDHLPLEAIVFPHRALVAALVNYIWTRTRSGPA